MKASSLKQNNQDRVVIWLYACHASNSSFLGYCMLFNLYIF